MRGRVRGAEMLFRNCRLVMFSIPLSPWHGSRRCDVSQCDETRRHEAFIRNATTVVIIIIIIIMRRGTYGDASTRRGLRFVTLTSTGTKNRRITAHSDAPELVPPLHFLTQRNSRLRCHHYDAFQYVKTHRHVIKSTFHRRSHRPHLIKNSIKHACCGI